MDIFVAGDNNNSENDALNFNTVYTQPPSSDGEEEVFTEFQTELVDNTESLEFDITSDTVTFNYPRILEMILKQLGNSSKKPILLTELPGRRLRSQLKAIEDQVKDRVIGFRQWMVTADLFGFQQSHNEIPAERKSYMERHGIFSVKVNTTLMEDVKKPAYYNCTAWDMLTADQRTKTGTIFFKMKVGRIPTHLRINGKITSVMNPDQRKLGIGINGFFNNGNSDAFIPYYGHLDQGVKIDGVPHNIKDAVFGSNSKIMFLLRAKFMLEFLIRGTTRPTIKSLRNEYLEKMGYKPSSDSIAVFHTGTKESTESISGLLNMMTSNNSEILCFRGFSGSSKESCLYSVLDSCPGINGPLGNRKLVGPALTIAFGAGSRDKEKREETLRAANQIIINRNDMWGIRNNSSFKMIDDPAINGTQITFVGTDNTWKEIMSDFLTFCGNTPEGSIRVCRHRFHHFQTIMSILVKDSKKTSESIFETPQNSNKFEVMERMGVFSCDGSSDVGSKNKLLSNFKRDIIPSWKLVGHEGMDDYMSDLKEPEISEEDFNDLWKHTNLDDWSFGDSALNEIPHPSFRKPWGSFSPVQKVAFARIWHMQEYDSNFFDSIHYDHYLQAAKAYCKAREDCYRIELLEMATKGLEDLISKQGSSSDQETSRASELTMKEMAESYGKPE